MSDTLPVHLLTGFLGSGKTTLLNHVLRSPAYANCAVLVNEFGEIGVDHHLIEAVHGDVVLMRSGCICCSIRGDLADAMLALHAQRDAGSIPAFERLILETTGLADPTPVLSTLMHERVLRHHFHLANIITTVDALHAPDTLARFPQALKQIAVADAIVLTKTDLATPEASQQLLHTLHHINALATVWTSAHQPPPASTLLGVAHSSVASSPSDHAPLGAFRSLARPQAPHLQAVRSWTMELPPAMDWTVFGIWLTLLLHAHGDKVLRLKGLLDVAGCDTPVVIHGVQHLVHPPSHLPCWPHAQQRRSQLVWITQGLEADAIQTSLHTFLSTFSAPAACETAALAA